MSGKVRAGILARVSTMKATQDESPERQIERLMAYAAARGWAVVAQARERVSGAKDETARPALAGMMGLAREKRIDALVVTKLDRLGRSLRNILTMWGELDELGVSVVVTDDSIDTSTAAGRLQRNVLLAFAEYQREDYAQRSAEGKRRAAAAGKHCARPRETIPTAALEIVARWMLEGPITWRQASERLASMRHVQPERVIVSTGVVRKARPWPQGSLWRAFQPGGEGDRVLARLTALKSGVQKPRLADAPRIEENAGRLVRS